jgi:hypothetical protein
MYEMIINLPSTIFFYLLSNSLVLNPQRQFYRGLKDAMSREYEDLMWVEDAIFMERNSRTFQTRIARIDENTEALCDFLRAHPKGNILVSTCLLFCQPEKYFHFLFANLLYILYVIA